MTTAIAINIILAAIVFAVILGLHGHAVRAHMREGLGEASDRRRVADRRARAAHSFPAHAERRSAERRYGQAATA
jgi:hypothetical protein